MTEQMSIETYFDSVAKEEKEKIANYEKLFDELEQMNECITTVSEVKNKEEVDAVVIETEITEQEEKEVLKEPPKQDEKEKTAQDTSTPIDEEQSNRKDKEILPYNDENCNILTKKITVADIKIIIEKCINANPIYYPQNDIGTSRMFYKCFKGKVIYVYEAKSWYIYNNKYWEKDDGNLKMMEIVKRFVMAYSNYALQIDSEALIKYTHKLSSHSNRENIVKDARSIAPKKLSEFDSNPYLFNCKNGTFNLTTGELQSHSSSDYITKIANVTYDETATCDRWVKFVSEIMQGDAENEKFLQKSFGYALSGEINLECFFIFYGSTTRNGKSTACETISNILGDYSTNAQAKSLAKNRRDGSSATPDIARLKGARFVTMAEPEKGLEIDVSLIKQLTGGDKYTGRFLNENPIEFVPEFKIFINTNHLPRVNDDTIFSSDRVKILPFERHFNPEEQDTGLKDKFKEEAMISGIFNWLVDGYKLLKLEGLEVTTSVMKATQEYREESDVFGTFLKEVTTEVQNARLQNSKLYKNYKEWCSDNGYHPLNTKNFIGEVKKRYDVKRNGKRGNEILGIELMADCPF